MAASLDGFIANAENTVAWMETKDNYDKGVEFPDKEAVAEFLKSIDCYVMGRNTYELALKLGWIYGETPTVVVTHRALASERPTVEFYGGDLQTLVNDRLAPRFKNVWLVGGARLAKDFLQQGLVDDIRMMIMPILIGGGTLFFDHVGREVPLHLKEVTAYKSGLVELWYETRKRGILASESS